jgi:DNA-directed RNA polymerase subunit RPC12/RpoP
MISCRVTPLTRGTCHPAPDRDGELRCQACGCRMFSSAAAKLMASGQRCVRCQARVELVPSG